MPVSIIYTNGNALDTLTFDATIEETHTATAQVTRHPIETGATVADHVIQDPDGLQLEALFVDQPLPGRNRTQGAQGRARELHDALLRIKATGTVVEVRTSIRSYARMIVESVKTPRNKKTKNAVRLSISLSTVTFADSQTVALAKTKLTSAQSKVNDGKQTGTTATDSERRRSWAKQFVSWIKEGNTPPGGMMKAPVK